MAKQKMNKTRRSAYLIYIGAGLLFLILGYGIVGYLYDLGFVIGSRGETSDPRPTMVVGDYPDAGSQETEGGPVIVNAPLEDLPEWDGSSRVTVLVMGLDYRDWAGGEREYYRTDTMMLLTIDPVTKTAGILSIPRDLWAAIPGFSPQKINAAHYFGDIYNYPGGGPALAVKTVENVIGVPIDYYARIDFNTFVRFIDLIGGVKVDVEQRIELETIGQAFDTVLEPGRYTLEGKYALAYVRNRYAGDGDFGRARRQQQVIMGIRDRLLNPTVFTMLIENAADLYAEFTQGILTNIPLGDALKLGILATKVEMEDITMRVIGEEHIVYGASPDELSILIPLPDKIRELRDQVFATNGSLTPAMEGDPLVLMQLEGARITIQNASYDAGLGQRTADYLTALGANVISVEQAGANYETTAIIDHTGNPYTLDYLVGVMNIYGTRIYHQMAMDSSRDVVLILGTQWQYNNPMP
jgi:LCP family protein required for cell wall assembly